MSISIDAYLERIKSIQPDMVVESVVFYDEGLVNDVVVVNQSTVFRFIKSEEGIKQLETELRVLEAIRPHISLPIPLPSIVLPDMVAYPYLKGETLTRARLAELDEPARQSVADQIGQFLCELHGIKSEHDLPATTAPVLHSDWLALRIELEKKVYPLMQKHQRAWADEVMDGMFSDKSQFDYSPCLIHGDLACYHLLFDPDLNRLKGVIDFGVAGLGDPANDLACLIQYYGEGFVKRFQKEYHGMDGQTLKRARFYAHALELTWILNGLNSGEPFWFTAHIGNKRDIE